MEAANSIGTGNKCGEGMGQWEECGQIAIDAARLERKLGRGHCGVLAEL